MGQSYSVKYYENNSFDQNVSIFVPTNFVDTFDGVSWFMKLILIVAISVSVFFFIVLLNVMIFILQDVLSLLLCREINAIRITFACCVLQRS